MGRSDERPSQATGTGFVARVKLLSLPRSSPPRRYCWACDERRNPTLIVGSDRELYASDPGPRTEVEHILHRSSARAVDMRSVLHILAPRLETVSVQPAGISFSAKALSLCSTALSPLRMKKRPSTSPKSAPSIVSTAITGCKAMQRLFSSTRTVVVSWMASTWRPATRVRARRRGFDHFADADRLVARKPRDFDLARAVCAKPAYPDSAAPKPQPAGRAKRPPFPGGGRQTCPASLP
jgi:hypothetical protein